jgi:hypothetical protein
MAEGAELAAADLPAPVREAIGPDDSGGAKKGAPRALATESRVMAAPEEASAVINVEALRRAIRESDPVSTGKSSSLHDIPAHFEHAKRTYLATLIDEFGGDLGLIARFWDRSSEKTIRKLIRDSGREEHLRAARERGPASSRA